MFVFLISSLEFHYRSDSEPALTYALKKNFKDSLWISCQIHLERNAKSNYCLATSMKEQNELMKLLFDNETGLSASMSLEEFEHRKSLIDASKFKNFDHLCSRILEGIVQVRITDPRIRVNWKSQDIESKNHTLKKWTNWEILTFDEIIEALRDCMLKDKNRLFKALYGCETAEWELVPEKKKTCKVTEEAFNGMSDKAKDLLLRKFFRLPPVPRKDQVVTSSDGKLSLPLRAQDTRRKPGIGPRKRGIRTTNFHRKRNDKRSRADMDENFDNYEVDDAKRTHLDSNLTEYQEDYYSDDEDPILADETFDESKVDKPTKRTKTNKSPKQSMQEKWKQFKELSKLFKTQVPDELPSMSPQESIKAASKPSLKLTSKDVKKRKPMNLKMEDLIESEEEFIANVEPSTARKMSTRNSKKAHDSNSESKPSVPDHHPITYGEDDIVSPTKDVWQEAMEKSGYTYADRMVVERVTRKNKGKEL